jgi:hypothetical protein
MVSVSSAGIVREDRKGDRAAREGMKRAVHLTYSMPRCSALSSALVEMGTSKSPLPVVLAPPVELH